MVYGNSLKKLANVDIQYIKDAEEGVFAARS